MIIKYIGRHNEIWYKILYLNDRYYLEKSDMLFGNTHLTYQEALLALLEKLED